MDIGGADGTTQILVTSGTSSYAIVVIVIVVIGIITWTIRKAKSKR